MMSAPKTLHLDTGKTMQGGQWQVLYLVERLKDAKLSSVSEAMIVEAQRRHIEIGARAYRWADLIHAHDAKAHTWAAWSNLGPRRRPLIVSRRVGFPIRRSFLSRWKYLQATLYLAVSRFVAARLEEGGVHRELIRVIYDGVPIPEQLTTRQPKRIIALASKPIQIPGLPIHLTTNLIQDLATASIFVYRSEMEGLGSAALAAQAAGVPVIASSVGGLPEAIEHERTGLLVDHDNFEPAIQRLLQNPKEAEEMGRRGRERVEQNFTIDHMVEKTKQAYAEVLR